MKLPTVFSKTHPKSQPASSAVALLLLCGAMPPAALAQIELSSETIASSALNVAEQTRTTGRCYAAVCRALHPLGVELSGAAAYQAQPLLLKDSRFVPLTVNSVDELRRGDIVVYTRSSTHPYGHISVYQGNYEEASDHLAPITHTKAYGGATVFRLRQGDFYDSPPLAAAPSNQPRYGASSYRNASYLASGQAQSQSGASYSSQGPYGSNVGYAGASPYLPPEAYQNQNNMSGTVGGADQTSASLLRSVINGYGRISHSPVGRSLLRKAANLLFGD
jgi:hypothetical protein